MSFIYSFLFYNVKLKIKFLLLFLKSKKKNLLLLIREILKKMNRKLFCFLVFITFSNSLIYL